MKIQVADLRNDEITSSGFEEEEQVEGEKGKIFRSQKIAQ